MHFRIQNTMSLIYQSSIHKKSPFKNPFLWIFIIIFIGLGCSTAPPKSSNPERSEVNLGDPWFRSARLGDWKTLKEIHEKENRDWDYRHQNGATALMVAARWGHEDLVTRLLKVSSNINITDIYNYNALSYLLYGPSAREQKDKLCRVFIQHGANAYQEDHLNSHPLLAMIELGLKDCLKQTLSLKDNPMKCNYENNIPNVPSLTQYAQEEEQSEVYELLKTMACP